MKTRIQKQEIFSFMPFDLILTVENEEEAKGLYAIFNYIPNTEVLPSGLGLKVCENLEKIVGKIQWFSKNKLANGVLYEDFYKSKK